MTAALVVGVLVVGGCSLWLPGEVQRRRRDRLRRSMPEPRSLVRILEGDDELREAVERAVQYERQVVSAASDRIERYCSVGHVAPVVPIGAGSDNSHRSSPGSVRDSA